MNIDGGAHKTTTCCRAVDDHTNVTFGTDPATFTGVCPPNEPAALIGTHTPDDARRRTFALRDEPLRSNICPSCEYPWDTHAATRAEFVDGTVYQLRVCPVVPAGGAPNW